MSVPEQIGRYELKHEIGRGGMATVYLAFDPLFRRNVAIKVMPPQFAHDETFRARFVREAQTVAALEHPAIVPVYDFGELDSQFYLVMRYMSGGTLSNRMMSGKINLEEANEIVRRLCTALDAAHAQGIIHRDLKPDNILFDRHGNAYLSDFGIVRVVATMASLTGNGIIGTPSYMSPEQVHGDKTLDGRSDIYALGTVLFEILTGVLPYKADTPVKQMMAHVLNPIPRILEIRQDLPDSMNILMQRALAKDREQRFQTAGELAGAMSAILATRGIVAAPHSPIDRSDVENALPAEKPNRTLALNHGREKTIELPEKVKSNKKENRFPIWIGFVILGIIVIGGGSYLLFGWEGRNSQDDLNQQPVAIDQRDSSPEAVVIATSPTHTPTATQNLPTEEPTLEPTSTLRPTEAATATERPSSTPMPTQEIAQIELTLPQVRASVSINVRTGPGVNFPAISALAAGTVVDVVAFSSNYQGWYIITLPDGRQGWVSQSVVESATDFEISQLPAPATIPAVPTATFTPISPTVTALATPDNGGGGGGGGTNPPPSDDPPPTNTPPPP